MNTTLYRSWNSLQRFQQEVNRALDARLASVDGSDSLARGNWSPAVDIKEEDSRYVLLADVPGVDPADIAITMDGDVLSIRGERKWVGSDEREALRRAERAHGAFCRRFSLPDSVDVERISARGSHGVLEIEIPKQEKVQPRRIPIVQ